MDCLTHCKCQRSYLWLCAALLAMKMFWVVQEETYAHVGMMQWSPMSRKFAYLHKTNNELDLSQPFLKNVSIVTSPLSEEQALQHYPWDLYGPSDLLHVSNTCNLTDYYRFWIDCKLQHRHMPIPAIPMERFEVEQNVLLSVYNQFECLKLDTRLRA